MSSTETSAPCPSTFTFTVTNRDGSTVDSGLFTYDSSADTLTTETSVFSYYNNSPYELTAHVAYDGGYAIAGTLDFDVVIDISCDSTAFDPFTVSDMTYSVFGTAGTQVLAIVQDSVSKAVGNQNGLDFCGNREFTITDPASGTYANWLDLDPTTQTLTLGLSETDLIDVGSYTIEVT